MTPVIEVDGLTVDLGGRRILDNLKCSLSARTIGLLGPNGAGKSTLINTLLGFHKPAQGTARIFGHDVRTEIRHIRNLVGYMPENDAFIGSMSAVSYVHLMAELSGLPPEAALERAHEALYYVGLGEARYRKLGTYSLGMRQLAKLAQAIAHGPKFLILDEPTNGLDPPARQRMIRLIREMRESGDLLLAPAARRGRNLRGGAHPETGPHRALREPGGGTAGESQIRRNGNRRGQWYFRR
jgi:ABC-2 type transport system ATP-binding protein